MSQHNQAPSLLNRIARVLRCLVFIHAVIGKLTGFVGVALMAVGSALVISGWEARIGAVLFHGDVADKMERIQLFKNLAIMASLLLVADQDSSA